MEKSFKIGFIGQGYVGKNYADNFEERGYEIVRYDISPAYISNKEKIKDCDIVLIAVPTPTLPAKGFDDSILIDVLKFVGNGKCAVIKSTMKAGTTEKLQNLYPRIYIFHSPEFLTESTARHDVDNPDINIVGYTDKSKNKAKMILEILPSAPYGKILQSRDAELIKYMCNVIFYMKVLTANMIYDVAQKSGANYDFIKEAAGEFKMVGKSHLNALHKGGRGAGGHCLIKDFAAFKNMYLEFCEDEDAKELLKVAEKYNKNLLKKSGKSLNLLAKIYE